MKKQLKMVFGVALGTVILLSVGAMLDFYPFLGYDIIVREIQFCSVVICVVIAICTSIILSEFKK